MSAIRTNNKIPGGAMVVGLVGSFYWMFTYSGPYRYLAELQIKWFGQYAPKLTMMVIGLGFLGIGALANLILRGAERQVPTMAQASAPGRPTSVGSRSLLSGATFASPYWRLWFLAIPLVMGGYFYFNATRSGELRELRAADFGNGQVTDRVLYAEVRGRLGQNYMTEKNYLYIPMRESAGTSEPVHLLIGVDEARAKTYLRAEADGTFTVRGMVERDSDAEVKYAFQKNGMALAEPCWVVRTGRDPASDKNLGLILMGITIVLGAGMASWVAYKSKRTVGVNARPLRLNT